MAEKKNTKGVRTSIKLQWCMGQGSNGKTEKHHEKRGRQSEHLRLNEAHKTGGGGKSLHEV